MEESIRIDYDDDVGGDAANDDDNGDRDDDDDYDNDECRRQLFVYFCDLNFEIKN